MEFNHKPVLLGECLDGLAIKPDGIYVDGTLGGAGHSKEIVKRLTAGRLIATDKDDEALAVSKERLKEYKDKVTLIHSDYKRLCGVLDELGIDKVDGILLDLGVSSYQLDNRERGFSYMGDTPLDMRMDTSQSLSAKEVVNEYSQERLAKIFWEYGEERFSRKIAANIAAARPLETTAQLAKIIEDSIPAAVRRKGGNPCKRVFQAIRIEVNEELDGLGEAITAMSRRLKKGGRICVITFHSLEDRIVKNAFNELAKDCICPPHAPICTCNKIQEVKLVNKKPVTASQEELDGNGRASSAKLRIAERII